MKRIPWNKGKKGVQTAWNKGLSGWRKHTKEWKKQQSERLKKQWADGLRNNKHLNAGNNPNWRGGVTPFLMRVRKLCEYVKWRTKVYERDRYTCSLCPQVGKKLTVDHIIPFSHIIHVNNIKTIEQARDCEKLWDISNGRTLCLECHKKTDTWGRRAISYSKVITAKIP